MSEVIVIGSGLAGSAAALRLRQAGKQVTLLTKGIGGLQLGQGTIDVLGYSSVRVRKPLTELPHFIADHPGHPYAVLGESGIRAGIDWLRSTLGDELASGDAVTNLHLPTAVGAIRPTALAPKSMLAGQVANGRRFCFVGIRELKDFHPQLVAENLNRTDLEWAGIPGGGRVTATHTSIHFPAREGEVDSSGLNIARTLDDPTARKTLVARIKKALPAEPVDAIGLPAVLGANVHDAHADIAAQLGVPVFEVPLPPPSVPGWRMNEVLMRAVLDARVRVVNGTRVIGRRYEGERLVGVTIKGTGREQEFTADEFVLAAGGFESGALVLDSHNQLHETVLGLPVVGGSIADLVHGDYWGGDQPIFRAGVAVDEQMRVLDAKGELAASNVRAAGGVLAGAQRWTEKSGEGIAVASAIRAADSIIAGSAGLEEEHR